MTAYFSVQIPDLTDHYNGRTYWITFAILASISFVCTFFIDRLLIRWSEVMGDSVEMTENYLLRKFHLKKRDENDDDD